jgi:tungstate transport system permease protein
MAAIIAGFGRIIGEVGAAIMLGGNIKHYTRTITTAIALETSKGEFGFAIALGIILMVVAFSVNILFRYFQQRGMSRKTCFTQFGTLNTSTKNARW